MKRARVVYVLSEVTDAPMFEWIAASHLLKKIELIFVFLNAKNSSLEENIRKLGIKTFRIHYAGKKISLIGAFFQLIVLFLKLKPQVVHTHLLAANLAGLWAAFVTRVPQRIYTRHHSDVHSIGPWYLRFYDHLSNWPATCIVATCHNVKKILVTSDKVSEKKVRVITFGFPEKHFSEVDALRVQKIREKYSYTNKAPVIGVISRYVQYKGVPFILSAFEEVLRTYPNACLVLANVSEGNAKAEIQKKLCSLPIDTYREIRFESDGSALMKSFDVFVHTPIDSTSEAFGQVYPEALFCRIPSVFTPSGVAAEFIVHEKNALLVPFKDAGGTARAIEKLLKNPVLCTQVTETGFNDVSNLFSLDRYLDNLRTLYLRD